MLRVSKMADYATVIMGELAKHDNVLTAKQIAENVKLTLPTVSKLLKLLANGGLLNSQLGAKGGYALARPADAISIAHIINAVEGPQGLTECSVHLGECALETVCAIRSNWQVISHAIHAALDSVSLASLVKPSMTIAKIDVNTIEKIGTAQV